MDAQTHFYEWPLLMDGPPDTGVERRTRLHYSTDGADGPWLDITLPADAPPSDGYPLILFLHGGPVSPGDNQPWPGDWRVFQDYGRAAASLGCAGVVINHRYLSYGHLPLAIGDILEALSFLRAEAGVQALDMNRVVLWVFSGAGMLLRPFLEEENAHPLRGLVAFYPMLDLTHVTQARAAFADETLIQFSPLAALETMPSDLPLFIARAGLDRAGLNRAVDTLVQQALYHNLPLELHNVPDGEHGFDFLNDTSRVRATIAHALRFTRTHLVAEE